MLTSTQRRVKGGKKQSMCGRVCVLVCVGVICGCGCLLWVVLCVCVCVCLCVFFSLFRVGVCGIFCFFVWFPNKKSDYSFEKPLPCPLDVGTCLQFLSLVLPTGKLPFALLPHSHIPLTPINLLTGLIRSRPYYSHHSPFLDLPSTYSLLSYTTAIMIIRSP